MAQKALGLEMLVAVKEMQVEFQCKKVSCGPFPFEQGRETRPQEESLDLVVV